MFKKRQNRMNGLGRGTGNGGGTGIGIGRGQGIQNRSGFGRGRRRMMRNIIGTPIATFFKPNGIPVSELEIVELAMDEFEALRLKNIEELNQTQSAEQMEISQSTFARILDSAYKKISDAIINGKAIEIIEE